MIAEEGAAAALPVLTSRQGMTLRAIKAHAAERGYAPTLRELCTLLGVVSTNAIHEHQVRLIALGVIKRDGFIARSIVITPLGEAWLAAHPSQSEAP